MKNPTNENYDVVIAGSGPAGMSAAIYSARAGLNVLIVEKEAPGGKVIKTGEIENYPGFTNINGADLAMHFYNQATTLGTKYEFSELVSYKKDKDLFTIKLSNGKELISKVLILATGTKENKIGVPGEDELYGKGVSYCAVCDASFYKNVEVGVVGGGYSAIEEAVYLTKFASKVYLVHRRDDFRVDHNTLEKAKSNPKIEWLLSSVVKSINGTSKVESFTVYNNKTNEEKLIEIKAVFPFVGHYPITNFVEENHILDENKNILTNSEMHTEIEGLFAAGDVRRTALRQISTAVGDGSMAGQKAVEYIDKKFN